MRWPMALVANQSEMMSSPVWAKQGVPTSCASEAAATTLPMSPGVALISYPALARMAGPTHMPSERPTRAASMEWVRRDRT